jgi:hypothetical protein
VGYVVTDTDSPLGTDVLEQLQQLPDTVRLRVLD